MFAPYFITQKIANKLFGKEFMHKNKNIIIQLVFWILLFLIINRIIGVESGSNFQTFWVSTVIVILFATISYLNIYLLVPQILTKKKYGVYIALILLISILIPVLFVEFGLIQLRCKQNNIIGILHNPFRPRLMLLFFISAMFLFVSTIIRLSLDFAKKERQRIQSEKERLLIETQYLRSQMNPHFFLNALNNLQYINRFLPEQSEKYINTLAEMMRYVTYDCKNDKVPIKKEIEYIKNYIYFQQVKDGDITVDFQVEIQNTETLIEPMLLMPFVENAFKYGIVEDTKNHPIFISIKQDKNAIYFSCKNSINHAIQTNSDPSYSGLGIQNVKDRLNASYLDKYNLKIVNDGISFIVELKLITPHNTVYKQ